MLKCPKCEATTRQNKSGKTEAGSQRYRCMHCQRKY
ncbi:MAG: IS1 family transposase, partial [Anaerolineales bacterium]|nr:IS1 family transposase [Anaerolineales bacterium]MBL8109355.1 IS1 family transposase [Anaerolineales bacterium]MBL8109993.1 IS1 family transposase [Anaerolineales bacterium]MBL8110110.1 IS1 family transposase [Anaerolineales bacterium]MBL8110328.1 IS1 family transposase [Anaerolineales bacterium]